MNIVQDNWLFLPVETKVRELDGKLLLALTAAEAGWRVVLGDQRRIRELTPRFPKGVYLDKSVTISKRSWFSECRKLGNQVVVLDEEGLVYFNHEDFKDLRIDECSVAMTDLMLLWGQDQREAVESCRLDKEVVVTGNPRFDVLRPELRSIYSNVKERIKEKYGRVILVNTSFPLANHYLGQEEMFKMYAKYPITAGRPNFYREWKEVHDTAMESFRRMLPALSEAFSKHTIILRPHPSENRDQWRKWLSRYPKIIVNSDGSMADWIASAELVIHFDCTSGIEAFAMGDISISYDEQNLQEYRQPLPNALSVRANSLEGLLALSNDIIHSESRSDFRTHEMESVANRHISALDGAFAVDRVVKAIERLKSGSGMSYRQWLYRRKYVIGRRVRTLAKPKPTESGYHSQKYPSTSREELIDRAESFSRSLFRFNSIEIDQIEKNCFVVVKQ